MNFNGNLSRKQTSNKKKPNFIFPSTPCEVPFPDDGNLDIKTDITELLH